VLMIGRNRLTDLVMIQQVRTGPGIFRQYEIHLLQHFKCPKCDVFEITDGGGDEVKQSL